MDKNYRIKWFETIDSTNSEAQRSISQGQDMDVFAALFQTAGRGQRGNKWESGRGKNLTFSILFKPTHILAPEQFIISKIVSLGVVKYLEKRGVQAKIKWPNDIYVEDRKICGILIENTIMADKVSASIAGIGVNINQREFSSDAPNPTSLLLERGEREDFDLKTELALLLDIISELYDLTKSGRFDLKQEYHEKLYRVGIKSRFRDILDGEEFEGTILGLDNSSCLMIQREDGVVKHYAFKEVKYLIMNYEL